MISVEGKPHVLRAFLYEPSKGYALIQEDRSYSVRQVFLPKHGRIWQAMTGQVYRSRHEAEQRFADMVMDHLPSDVCSECGEEFTNPDASCDACAKLKILNLEESTSIR